MPAMASRTAITAAASAVTQPHTESPSPRGQYGGEASLLMRAVIGNSEGPREKKSIRNYNSNSGTRRRYQLYTCTCRHV